MGLKEVVCKLEAKYRPSIDTKEFAGLERDIILTH
jgi:hypothetical protein